MTKYYDGYDNGNNEINEDGNYSGNSTSKSASDGTLFDPMMTTRPHLILVGKDRLTTATALRPWHTMYLRFYINIFAIN